MLYRPMTLADYDDAFLLWQQTRGIQLRESDSKVNIKRYLQRNLNLSFVCEDEGNIIGTIMAGHDGRRGYVQHLAVASSHQKLGIATRLIDLCLTALKNKGISKTHIHVLADNLAGQKFWHNRGWHKREDLVVYSYLNTLDDDT